MWLPCQPAAPTLIQATWSTHLHHGPRPQEWAFLGVRSKCIWPTQKEGIGGWHTCTPSSMLGHSPVESGTHGRDGGINGGPEASCDRCGKSYSGRSPNTGSVHVRLLRRHAGMPDPQCSARERHEELPRYGHADLGSFISILWA